MSKSPSIKGYSVIRLRIPNTNRQDESFMYVKIHADASQKASTSMTLFVANVPTIPKVHSVVLLQSLFSRYGNVKRVTAIANPRIQSQDHMAEPSSWTDNYRPPSFLPASATFSSGKFAHVVFSTAKEMKKAHSAISKVMSSKSPHLELDRLDLQTLADESERRHATGSLDYSREDQSTIETMLLNIARRYEATMCDREQLSGECNAVMRDFEDKEEKDRITREALANQPDDNGFVTVTYTAQVGSKRELEKSEAPDDEGRRKGKKRNRKKKESIGATQLEDFYRFQTKEKRKRSLHELRARFEEDLAKVKRMKEARQYRPFT